MANVIRAVLMVTQEQVYDYTQCALALIMFSTIAVLSLLHSPIPDIITWSAAAVIGAYFKGSPTKPTGKYTEEQ